MDPRANIIARMYALLGMLTLFGGLVAVQLGRVHLVEGPALREQGQRQAESVKEIPAIRGTIYDQAGRALAYNTARYDLAVDPSVEGFRSEKERLLANLGRLTQTSAAKYRRRLDGSPSPKYALLARSLSETQKMEVDSWGIPGLILSPKFARHYTYGETASHVVGMVDADFTGIEGVEKRYHEFLDGTPGFRIVQRDMRGRIKSFIGGPTKQPEHGEHIVLTIDQVRQAIMEEELAKGIEAAGAKWGTAIAMDPHTGAILAMASVPTYDPNRP
ncbi:MAG: penicillin-binding protein, partial [Bacteroidota bacterium]